MNNNLKILAQKELVTRELERRYSEERWDLIEFIKTFFKEERPKGIEQFSASDFHYIIADKLDKVTKGEINRLIINIPPWHGKTIMVTQMYPVWRMWNNPYLQVISTWYATNLTRDFSWQAKECYKSPTFNKVFPRSKGLSKDTNEHWVNEDGWSYYATWISGALTGKRANLFIIDDPIKPDEADKSDIVRDWVNNWYSNTVVSRLFKPSQDAVIIIMQRTHENDLCWDLISKMQDWHGEEWDVLSLPAIAEEEEYFETDYGIFTREIWNPLDPIRFWLGELDLLKKDKIKFECQYQQNPTSKETQEFHEEWFKYYDELPYENWRIFSSCDPAFSKNQTADNSVVTTGKFIWDRLYILEQTVGKFDPSELEDKLVYHIRKWSPEKMGIEAFQAQQMIVHSLQNRLRKEWLYHTQIEEIRQNSQKEIKIRRLIPLYRNGLIYHKPGAVDTLEQELLKFPRGKHDDCPDSLQMLYEMYELQPTIWSVLYTPKISYDKFWRPKIH